MIILMVLKIALLFHVPVVMAEPTISGFINAVGGYAMDRETHGYEAEELNFSRDSLFGIQLSQDLSPKISATGQVIARGSDNNQVEASWAYLTYHLTDSAQFRMGRFRTPFFLYSDYLDIGYAQHWIAPPDEVYALQFDSVDGVDLTYHTSFGRVDTQLQLYFGSSENEFLFTRQDLSLDVRLREQMGAVGTINYGWLTLRGSFHQATRLTIDNFQDIPLPTPLENIRGLKSAVMQLSGIDSLSRNANYIIDHLDVQDVATEFTEFAIKMQWQHFFIIGEGTLLTFDDSPLAKQRRHLVSAGTTWHDVTLYVTYARANDEPVDLASALPDVDDNTQNLKAALQQLTNSLSLESESTTFGLRYDLDPGAAFKLEIAENVLPKNYQSNLIRVGFHLVF